MRTGLLYIVLAIGLYVSFSAFTAPDKWGDETPLAQVLYSMGKEKPAHYIEVVDSMKAEMGREIVLTGRTTGPNGRKSKYVSKYFVCTDCHNQVREDPLLPESNPESRLDYSEQNDLPFLQATTFWGIVNREGWYNNDYYLKYGEDVKKANSDLGEATQLCAVECSSGRPLEDWELEAIMHYYWTLQLTMGDLDLEEMEWRKIRKFAGSEIDRHVVVDLLDKKYLRFSPAHFGDVPEDKSKGYPVKKSGDATKGKMIYDRSCLHCHRQYGPSQLILDDSKFTMNKFKRHLEKSTDFNLYQIIRKGTHAEAGHQQYMPHFPLERMSDQQVEDLRSYILSISE